MPAPKLVLTKTDLIEAFAALKSSKLRKRDAVPTGDFNGLRYAQDECDLADAQLKRIFAAEEITINPQE